MAETASVIIALCALIFTLWHAHQVRKHNRISVTPHLATWTHTDQDNHSVVVELMNNGIGPAMINFVELRVDDKPVVGEETELVSKALKILFPNYEYTSHQSYFSDGYVMAEKEKRPFVAVKFFGERVPTAEEVSHAMKRSRLIIEYQSMYGRCFCLDSGEEKSNKEFQQTQHCCAVLRS